MARSLEVPANWVDCPWGEPPVGVGRLHGAGTIDNMKLDIVEMASAVRVTVPKMTGKVVFYDATGSAVRTLDANADAATEVVWDKTNDDGASITPGVYVVRARTPAGYATGRVPVSR